MLLLSNWFIIKIELNSFSSSNTSLVDSSCDWMNSMHSLRWRQLLSIELCISDLSFSFSCSKTVCFLLFSSLRNLAFLSKSWVELVDLRNVSLLVATFLKLVFGFWFFLPDGSWRTSSTLGKKTKQSVIDVQKKMNIVMRMRTAFWFCTMNAIAAPEEHIINTL